MTEHRRTSNEGDPAGNRLNREDFLRRTELLRRIHWKTWMLLVSFAAYGVLPFAVVQFEEIGKDFFPFLLLVSMIFFLENRLNGKCFRCPVCQTPFRPGTAALVIASGRCPACSEEILELPGGGGDGVMRNSSRFTIGSSPDAKQSALRQFSPSSYLLLPGYVLSR